MSLPKLRPSLIEVHAGRPDPAPPEPEPEPNGHDACPPEQPPHGSPDRLGSARNFILDWLEDLAAPAALPIPEGDTVRARLHRLLRVLS